MRIYAVLIILGICIPVALGTSVVSNSATTAAGSVSYSIDYLGTGILQNAPVEKLVANDNSISASITGCSILGAYQIKGALTATAANGHKADVSAEIDGPGASVTNYNLYGNVLPTSAWAGQYVESARGTNITFQAIGKAEGWANPMNKGPAVAEYWAGSYLLTHRSAAPVYTVNNWYQDAMSGGPSYWGEWTMTDIYSGKATVHSSDPKDWVDVYTGGEDRGAIYDQTYTVWKTGANEWVPQNNFIGINGQSMGYADYNLGYSNVDGVIANGQHVYTYYIKNNNLGINKTDTIYW